MKTYVLLTEKSWHDSMFESLKQTPDQRWVSISNPDDFTIERLTQLKPDSIFIPHWSYLISKEIYDRFECIVFHMTDLPFGRGGSPLQNLIVRGFQQTKISAIRVEKGIDAGPVYLKCDLSLEGTARQIFERAADVIVSMIRQIISDNLQPLPQEGTVVEFKRRKPEDGNLAGLSESLKIYDYIRMLDCEGYPPAYLDTDSVRYEFTGAKLNADQTIEARVRIIKK